MTTGDRSHSATETVEAERETHQSEGFGARQWTKRFRAPQSPKTLKQNWIAKASSALSRRLHNSKVLIISVNMVLVIILLLFKAATLYKWPVWIETLLQNDPDYTADQIFSHAYSKARADGYMAGSQCATKGSYRSNLCTGKWTNNAVQHSG